MDERNPDDRQQHRQKQEDDIDRRIREMCPKERQFYEALADISRRIAATAQESAAKALPSGQDAGDDE